MNRTVLLLGLLLALPVSATVYRWTDDTGQVHYSDMPHPGAEEVQLSSPQTFSAPPVAGSVSSDSDANSDADDDAGPYTTLEIARPGKEETLWNIEGLVQVSVDLSPQLQPGHSLQVYLDDQPLSGLGQGLSFQLPDVPRGTHTLRATVEDRSGNLLNTSPTTTFYIRQTSITNPVNPQVPKPKPNPKPNPKPTPLPANNR